MNPFSDWYRFMTYSAMAEGDKWIHSQIGIVLWLTLPWPRARSLPDSPYSTLPRTRGLETAVSRPICRPSAPGSLPVPQHRPNATGQRSKGLICDMKNIIYPQHCPNATGQRSKGLICDMKNIIYPQHCPNATGQRSKELICDMKNIPTALP